MRVAALYTVPVEAYRMQVDRLLCNVDTASGVDGLSSKSTVDQTRTRDEHLSDSSIICLVSQGYPESFCCIKIFDTKKHIWKIRMRYYKYEPYNQSPINSTSDACFQKQPMCGMLYPNEVGFVSDYCVRWVWKSSARVVVLLNSLDDRCISH